MAGSARHRAVQVAVLAALCAAPGRAGQLQQPPTSYPLCTSSDLAAFPWTHPAYGKQIPGIALRNMSLSICRVAGFPKVRAYVSTGQLAPIRFVRKPFIDTRIYAYSVTPGSAVFFALYGNAPHGEYDRSCVGINQLDIVLPQDNRAIDVAISTGTCGGTINYSQMFPVSELARSVTAW